MSSYEEDIENKVSYEIIYRILNHIETKNRALKTRILYASNLNSRSLEKYLRFLLKNSLVSEVCVNEKRYYVLTHKGRGFLYKLRKIREDIDNHPSKRLADIIRDEYREMQSAVSMRESSKKRLHIVIVDSNSGVREAVSELILGYVNARIDGEEVLGLVPSRLYDKILEVLENLKINLHVIRLHTYNELEDLRELASRIVNMLRGLETQYVIVV